MVATKVVTAAELSTMLDDGFRYDLIRGELIRMMPTGFEHLVVIGNANWHLLSHVRANDLGIVGGEGGFRLEREPDTVLGPDVVFVRKDRVPPRDQWQGFAEVVPDLVMEVYSPSDRAGQFERKIAMYVKVGVPIVWAVYPSKRTVRLHRPDGSVTELSEHDWLDGEDVLPGFRLKVAELFG